MHLRRTILIKIPIHETMIIKSWCQNNFFKVVDTCFFLCFFSSFLDVLGLFLKKEREKEDEILIRIFSSMKSVFVADRSLYHCN